MRKMLLGLLLAGLAVGVGAEGAFRYTNLPVRTLASGKKIDLVVVPDGYLAADLGTNRQFDKDARLMLEELWRVPPFSEYRQLFNVHLVDVESKGSRQAGTLEYAFGSTVTPGRDLVRLERRQEVLTAAGNAPGADLVIVLTRMAGRATGGKVGSTPVPVIPRDRYTSLAHELGHSLADLGDEYESGSKLADRDARPLSAYSADVPYPNLTLDAYIDATSRDAIRRTAKWGHFLDLPGSDPLVSAYQGGLYNTVGVWRPSYRCVMRSSRGASFCPVCHEELTRKLYAMAGETFDHDDYHRRHPLKNWK